jgi:hypothetical protein
MKTEQRELARSLRREGRSVKEIARMVGVSLSSVSLWVRDVELTPEARAALHDRNPTRNGEIVRAANLERARARRTVWQDAGREHARRGDPLHQIGCMLYWAEGAKSRTSVQFCNSDPAMVALFVEFLQSCYDAPVEAIGLRAHLYADHDAEQKRIEEFWLDVARLPRACLRRSTVNRVSRSSKGKRVGRLPYGTCRITLHRAVVVQSIFGAIQEYGGFERPEWLG